MEKTIETESTGLVVYQDYRTQIADFKKLNETLVFDYTSKKGNKDAKSHVGRMKKSIKAIERVRIDDAKAYKLKINDEADSLTRQVEKMIKVHQVPLDEFDNKEKLRIAVIEKRIQDMFNRDAGTTAKEIQKEMDYISGIDMDESWDELLAKAVTSQFDRVTFLKDKLDARIQYEADQAELVRLRAESEERKNEGSSSGLGSMETQCDFETDAETPGVGELTETEVAKNNSVDSAVKENQKPVEQSFTRRVYNNKPPLKAYDDEPALQTAEPIKPELSMKEKREQAKTDIIALGFSEKEATLLFNSISFQKIRWIKFNL